ncbi:D-TA family PLP-dependent enzyme [Pseudaminobacter sp. 19-2017]|uniref:D-TA family PLP-dependent enzyme n=1 Tax=Pseudaminobacter soli (ex Zhang et al. 2022) TaxID=2831468 RepID=A0A942E3P2_9HYPH|nr:D-TA family PLP-dependent enzyme [Pseudaminobacter soli]MBS3650515.1 D-TA family PLP-dependent enzyme [Pseudaminobacter soli]
MLIEELDTPAVVIDRRLVEANLGRAQEHANRRGLKLRPHIKTHKLPLFAQRQVELGAAGITCQKIGEAEVMADAGLQAIFISYNIIGRQKLERLLALHRRVTLSVVADSPEAVDGYASVFTDAARPLAVLVECDTGAGRCGVQTPVQALELAKRIASHPGLRFEGLMAYPARGKIAETDAWLSEALDLFKKEGIEVRRVSNGGSPDFYADTAVASATEHRPGTYIYSDRMQVGWGHGSLEDCALTVLATVVSRPTPDRVILDAGSKALAADTCAAPGHGHIVEYPEAVITMLNEEHGIADFSRCASRPAIGEKVRIIPNHVCVVTNLFDEVHLVEDGEVVQTLPVAARGRMG